MVVRRYAFHQEQEQYLTSECSRVRYSSCHEHVMFLSSCRHTDDSVFDDFPRSYDHSLKILQNFSKGHTKVAKNFAKISEDCQLLKTFEEDPMMFRSYTNKFKYNLRDKLGISKIMNIFTMPPVSQT